jgi:hypothetical protein
MAIFVKKLLLFLLLNVVIFVVLLFAIHAAFVKKHWENDPDVFVIPSNQTYDMVFMGTSHAQVFTRYHNLAAVEDTLHKHFFNFAQPDAGPVMENIYLQYFLQQHNHARTLVYFLDPHVFYYRKSNEDYYLLPYGTLDASFLKLLIQNHVGFTTIYSYIKTYASFKWFIKQPRIGVRDTRTFTGNLSNDTQIRIARFYPNGLDEHAFNVYQRVLNQITSTAEKQKMKVVFLIPPTLMRSEPGMKRMKKMLKEYRSKNQINYYDFSAVMTNPSFYSDIDHLNSNGVELFSKKYLTPIPELR